MATRRVEETAAPDSDQDNEPETSELDDRELQQVAGGVAVQTRKPKPKAAKWYPPDFAADSSSM